MGALDDIIEERIRKLVLGKEKLASGTKKLALEEEDLRGRSIKHLSNHVINVLSSLDISKIPDYISAVRGVSLSLDKKVEEQYPAPQIHVTERKQGKHNFAKESILSYIQAHHSKLGEKFTTKEIVRNLKLARTTATNYLRNLDEVFYLGKGKWELKHDLRSTAIEDDIIGMIRKKGYVCADDFGANIYQASKILSKFFKENSLDLERKKTKNIGYVYFNKGEDPIITVYDMINAEMKGKKRVDILELAKKLRVKPQNIFSAVLGKKECVYAISGDSELYRLKDLRR